MSLRGFSGSSENVPLLFQVALFDKLCGGLCQFDNVHDIDCWVMIAFFFTGQRALLPFQRNESGRFRHRRRRELPPSQAVLQRPAQAWHDVLNQS